MYHFVCLIWDALDEKARVTAAVLGGQVRQASVGWSCAMHAEGIAVYTQELKERALQTYLLPDDAGVVLGKLFHMDPATSHSIQTKAIDQHEAHSMVRTAGQRLFDEYWGAYIAFLRERDGKRCYVVRDCSGRLPCYRIRHGGVEIIFSDIADLPRGLPPFTFNRRYLAAFIYWPQLQIRESGFNEITEILAGECLEIRADKVRQACVWDPAAISQNDSMEKYSEAVTSVRSTTQRCVDAWSKTSDHVLLKLSGGLDSAIVLGCLRKTRDPESITCVHQFGENPREDERSYAKLAAACANVKLIEYPMDTPNRLFDTRLFSTPRTAKPSVSALFMAFEVDTTIRLAMELKAEALWTGEGGDHLFLETRSALSAADYIARHGVSFGLPAAVRDAANLSRKPYVSVIRSAWQLSNPRTTWMPDFIRDHEAQFVCRDALPERAMKYVFHPWVENIQTLPKGKQWQIHLIADVLHRRRPLPGLQHVYERDPLLSRPLIELCLHIPTYILLHGGRSRALARDAFKDVVPPEILQRQSKGDMTFTVADTIRRSEPFIQELLLDGILVNHGIISRKALEPYIVHRRPLRQEQYRPLLACIAGEIWARTWTDARMMAA